MITPQNIALAVIATSGLLVLTFVLRPHVTATRAGKILAFVCLLILPGVSMMVGTEQHMTNMQSTTFCLSCHTMDPYGRSLHLEDTSAIPASHYQNNRVPREAACYTCHTDYEIFGGIRSKIRGIHHVYAQYFTPHEPPIKLYHPFPNANCLHCHAGTRKFLEGATHTADPETIPKIMSGQLSCVSSGCHDLVHDVAHQKDAKMWQEPKP